MRKPLVTFFLALTLANPLFARGDFWDFLGYAQVKGGQDHSRIQIKRQDGSFRAIQLRVTGGAVFFDHLVLHFVDGTSQDVAVGGRVAPQGRDCVVELAGEGRVLESLDLWYYKETWLRTASVTLYGTR